MKHDLGARDGLIKRTVVEDRPVHEADALRLEFDEVDQVLGGGVAQVIDDADGSSHRDEGVDDVPADESGPAGDAKLFAGDQRLEAVHEVGGELGHEGRISRKRRPAFSRQDARE
ncbi:MAG: hypothetical protein QM783_17030 [Phycisphaerales bacterium]